MGAGDAFQASALVVAKTETTVIEKDEEEEELVWRQNEFQA